MKNVGFLLGLVLLARMTGSASAGELALKVAEKAPPQEISESMRKTLQPRAIQLVNGNKIAYEFWLRNEIPLKAKSESPSKGLEAMGEVTFLGVAVVGEGRRDYKDNEIAPGTYTMRFSLQPQDGDHLGTAEYPYFAALIPAKSDTDLESIKTYRAMVKASARGSAAGHPLVLSLRPASGDPSAAPVLTTPTPEHKAVKLTVPAKTPEGQTASVTFELVYEGRYKG